MAGPALPETTVWGLPIRVIHWALVAAFFLPFIVGEDAIAVHEGLGYVAAILIVGRIVYGILGSEDARLRHLVFPPADVVRYLIDLARFRPKKYRFHTPAGGAMVILLFLLIAATVVSGAGLELGSGDAWEEAHEGLANLTVLLVVLHIAGTTATALAQRELPVLPIVGGRRHYLLRRPEEPR